MKQRMLCPEAAIEYEPTTPDPSLPRSSPPDARDPAVIRAQALERFGFEAGHPPDARGNRSSTTTSCG